MLWPLILVDGAGSSGDMLSIDQQAFIDDYCRSGLDELGCDFPYDKHFGKSH